MQNQDQADFDSLVPGRSVNRRVFLSTAIGAGFAVAVQPALGQTPQRTDSDGLSAGEVKVPVADGQMVAYRAISRAFLKSRKKSPPRRRMPRC